MSTGKGIRGLLTFRARSGSMTRTQLSTVGDWRPFFTVFALNKWNGIGLDVSVVLGITQCLMPVAHENTCLIVVGGFSKQQCHEHVECFNIDERIWRELPPLRTRRSSCFGGAIGDDIIVAGGNQGSAPFLKSAEAYNFATNTWRTLPDLCGIRTDGAAVVFQDRLVVIGGHNGQAPLRTCESFDPRSNRWHYMVPPNFGTPRYYLDACVIPASGGQPDRLMIAGGHNGSSYLSSAEMYNSATQQWSPVARMHHRRGYCSMATLYGKPIVVGGYDAHGGVVRSVEEYDPQTDKWTLLRSCRTGRANCALGVVSGKLVVAGGFDKRHLYLKSAELYDRAANQWEKLPPMKHKRSSCANITNVVSFLIR